MTEIKLYRSGKRPIVFIGEEIASASTRELDSTRWVNASVYQSENGNIILGVAQITCWHGERDRFEAESFSCVEGAVSYIEDHHPILAEEISEALGVFQTI